MVQFVVELKSMGQTEVLGSAATMTLLPQLLPLARCLRTPPSLSLHLSQLTLQDLLCFGLFSVSDISDSGKQKRRITFVVWWFLVDQTQTRTPAGPDPCLGSVLYRSCNLCCLHMLYQGWFSSAIRELWTVLDQFLLSFCHFQVRSKVVDL